MKSAGTMSDHQMLQYAAALKAEDAAEKALEQVRKIRQQLEPEYVKEIRSKQIEASRELRSNIDAQKAHGSNYDNPHWDRYMQLYAVSDQIYHQLNGALERSYKEASAAEAGEQSDVADEAAR